MACVPQQKSTHVLSHFLLRHTYFESILSVIIFNVQSLQLLGPYYINMYMSSVERIRSKVTPKTKKCFFLIDCVYLIILNSLNTSENLAIVC